MLFWILPLKAKSITEFSVQISCSYGGLVYILHNSYAETDTTVFLLFKVSITGLLFRITQNELTPN